ncbi:MAG: aspartate aminotransferase family protein [Bacteroidetes bacterium]|nr:aspartate aminotransferase family protein [Bacteroidota bacterium]
MTSHKQLFLKHFGQTSVNPIAIEIEKARGIYLFTPSGKKYIDLISGVCVSNLGHNHPKVIKAVKDQVDKHLHLMVYGELIQKSQIDLVKLLNDNLPSTLNSIYLVNSGSEAVEGAMKLAKRVTGRHEIVAFKKSYHGSTHGALSILGDESYKDAFRPLIPSIRFLEFNRKDQLDQIGSETACVIVEPVQGEAGVIMPVNGFLSELRERCLQTGTLLVFDEVQTGLGRTGALFAFEQFKVLPDILVLAKALGGGMPLGAFISSSENMSQLKTNPPLGHITTFGGHPVSCASAYAALQVLIEEKIITDVVRKGKLFKKLMHHQAIRELRGLGLFLAVELKDPDHAERLIEHSPRKGFLIDSFLFRSDSFRIAPPLNISDEEIRMVSKRLLKLIEETH